MKLIFAIFLLSLVSFNLFPQSEEELFPLTNLEIFNFLLDSSFLDFNDILNFASDDFFYRFSIDNEDEQSEFLIRYLINTFPKKKFLGPDTEASNIEVTTLSLKNYSLSTKYEKTGSLQVLKKSIFRKINIEFDMSVIRNDSLSGKLKFSKQYSGEFDYDKINYVESGNYSFLKGKLPEQSFWDRFLIPMVSLVTSAVAIILFFSIRSK